MRASLENATRSDSSLVSPLPCDMTPFEAVVFPGAEYAPRQRFWQASRCSSRRTRRRHFGPSRKAHVCDLCSAKSHSWNQQRLGRRPSQPIDVDPACFIAWYSSSLHKPSSRKNNVTEGLDPTMSVGCRLQAVPPAISVGEGAAPLHKLRFFRHQNVCR